MAKAFSVGTFSWGFLVFLKALRQTLNNPGAAIGVSLVPLVLAALSAFCLILSVAFLELVEGNGLPSIAVFAAIAVFGLTTLFLLFFVPIWVAVGWHRFVLLGEYPRIWFPRLHKDACLDYFVGLMKFLVALLLLSVFVVIPLSLFTPVTLILSELGYPVFQFAFLTLCVSLPGVAAGQDVQLRKGAFRALEMPKAILAVTFFLWVFQSLPSLLAGGPLGAVFGSLTYFLTSYWFLFMLNFGVLTALYQAVLQDAEPA